MVQHFQSDYLDRGDEVVGIDNHNDYYDPALKEARLARHADHPNYTHIRMNLEDREAMAKLFKDHQFEGVVNLAAQAGVRYSIENPLAYIDTNLVGFAHILEGCRHNKVGTLCMPHQALLMVLIPSNHSLLMMRLIIQ